MASVSVFDLTRFTALAAGDVLPAVDISNTSQNAHGSLLSITVTNFFSNIPVNVGIGAAADSAIGLNVRSANLTGTTQFGMVSQHVSTSGATVRSTACSLVGGNAAGAYTVTSVSQLFVDDWQKGAGSTLTTQYGVFVASQTQGATNYAILTNLGLVSFGDAVDCSSTLNVQGGFSVATNKFTVVAASGNTAVAGTLAVTGTSAFTGAVTAPSITAIGANADLTLAAVGAGGQLLFNTNGTLRLTIANTGTATFTSTIATAAPTGGAGNWLLGIANTVSPTAPNRTITVSIGGVLYYIHAKTSND